MSFDTAIRSSLQQDPTAFGFWLTLPSAGVAKTILRANAGAYKWVLIDAEHGLISDAHYYDLVNAVASEGASPLIRVPWSEEWLLKRALDAGAHGIVTPMCHSAKDAEQIVKFSKYPPTGSRGYGPMFAPHSLLGLAPSKYDAGAEKGLLVIVQIESRSGVENVEDIAKVEGVDVVFIGPFDLALQMGVTRGGQEHEAAIQRVLKAARAAGKKAAIFCSNGQDAATRTQQGFDMVSVTTDVAVLAQGFQTELAIAQGRGTAAQKPRDGY